MIKYNFDKLIDYKQLIILFNQVEWHDKTIDVNRLEKMVENSQIVITAWDEEKLVGFVRCITDYVYNGQINNLVVHEAYRRKGIGKCLINSILDSNKQVSFILRGDPDNENFYKSLGFEDSRLTFLYKRKF